MYFINILDSFGKVLQRGPDDLMLKGQNYLGLCLSLFRYIACRSCSQKQH